MAPRGLIFIFTLFFISFNTRAQTVANELDSKRLDLGLSVQLYPAGIIPTVNLEQYLSEQSSLVYRLGANIVDRQDFSEENDQEKGAGFGASFGYRKHYLLKKGKIVAGLNLDIWNLWINWKNNSNGDGMTSGTTYTFVMQPWLEGGYFFNLKNSNSQLGATLGFGREINAISNGKDVEQGWMASLTAQYLFSLRK